MILALLMALQTPAQIADWDGLPFPDGVGRPAARYITCLSVPLEPALASGDPADPTARKALLDTVLAGCRATRAQVAAEMDVTLAGTPGWTDPAIRRLKIERMLGATEERVGFAVVDREAFLKRAQDVIRCAQRPDAGCAGQAVSQPPR